MDTKEMLEAALAPLKPVLDSAGRAIEVVEVTPTSVTFKLAGFCSGCECSGSYKEGLNDMVQANCPQITNVQFIEA